MAFVGTAVEYAAELADERPADERTTPVVSFKAAFERTEASDDASPDRASILEALHGLFPDGVKFDAGKVISRLKESEKWAEDNHVPEDACIVDLRHFCTSRRANAPSAKSANLALKTILKAPVRTEAGMLTLRCEVDTHVRRTSFYVEFKPDKAKEEPAPEVKEVDFDEEFPFEKPAPFQKGRVLARGWNEVGPWSELEALVAANAKPSA